MRLRLEVTAGGQARNFSHPGPTVTIGRDPSCDLTFPSALADGVSREHAEIALTPRGAFLRDLGSSNGTFVNGRRVGQSVEVRAGDQIGLGLTGPKLRVIEIEVQVAPTVRQKPAPPALPALPPPLPSVIPVARVAAPAAFPLEGPSSPPGQTRAMLVVLERRQRALLLGGCAAILCLTALFAALLGWQSGWFRGGAGKKDTDERSAKRETEGERGPLRPEEVYRRALQSAGFVTVLMRSVPVPGGVSHEFSTGSAVLVDRERRLLVTAHHVVEDRTAVRVQFPLFDGDRLVVEVARYPLGEGIPGQVVTRDPRRDLAVIQLERLPESARPMPLATASPSPGAAVQAVGNPGASAARWVHSQGAVRQVVHKRVQASNPAGKVFVYECWMVETQTPINQGDSGGPLINDRCELVGINSTGGGKGSLMNNCIDIREVKDLLARVAP